MHFYAFAVLLSEKVPEENVRAMRLLSTFILNRSINDQCCVAAKRYSD